jgi:hypothetical protein
VRAEELLIAPWWVALELPAGWEIDRMPSRAELIVARPRGEKEWFLGIEPVELGMYTMWEVAQAAMRRHAPYGPPEVFAEVVDGRGAFYFAWTDGVMDVGTWWVHSRNASPRASSTANRRAAS